MKQFPRVTYGINFLVCKQDYPIPFKIAYLMNYSFQSIMSADSVFRLVSDMEKDNQLFKLIKSLDLAGNKYINSFGLTRYVRGYLEPWL